MPTDIALTSLAMPLSEFPAIAREAEERGYRTAWVGEASGAEALAAAGYDTAGVLDQGMGGWLDPLLWAAVQREGRFFVTADKGFGDIRGYPPGTHAGILVLRPDEDGIRPQVGLIAKVLSRYRLEDLAGGTTVVSPRGIRIRHAPERQGA